MRQVLQAVAVDKQGIESIADTTPTAFGVCDDVTAHCQVASFIEIAMHNACSGLYDGHFSRVSNEVYQAFTAAWNAQVHEADGSKKLFRGFMVCWKEFNDAGIDVVCFQNIVYQGYSSPVTFVSILPTF